MSTGIRRVAAPLLVLASVVGTLVFGPSAAIAEPLPSADPTYSATSGAGLDWVSFDATFVVADGFYVRFFADGTTNPSNATPLGYSWIVGAPIGGGKSARFRVPVLPAGQYEIDVYNGAETPSALQGFEITGTQPTCPNGDAPTSTGHHVSSLANYVVCEHVITAVGPYTWTPPAGVTSVDAVVVAGGGGGGGLTPNGVGGGGGAGGVTTCSELAVPSGGFSGDVGAGGTGGPESVPQGGPSRRVHSLLRGAVQSNDGGNGGDSTVVASTSTVCSATGGFGGMGGGDGSGGGYGGASGGGYFGGVASATQGGGGAGQSSNGLAHNATSPGAGGAGVAGGQGVYEWTGLFNLSVRQLAGGGGGGTSGGTAGGVGATGGGNGAGTTTAATAGAANTGGGGGGGGGNSSLPNALDPKDGVVPARAVATGDGAAGGSGVVIFRYALPAVSATKGTWIERAANPVNGGSCLAPSHPTITAAVAVAVDDDIVHVCPGFYQEPTILTNTLGAPMDITIKGDGTDPESVVVDGSHTMDTSGHRVFVHMKGGSLTLQNLTVQNGYGGPAAFGGTSFSEGGGVFVYDNASLTTTDVVFSGNYAVNNGGAAFVDGAATLTDSTFDSNRSNPDPTAGYVGGAIFAASITSLRSSFLRNTGYNGGAMYAHSGMSVTDSTFTDNVGVNGGAILSETTASVTDSAFSGNVAIYNAVNGSGGAIHTTSPINVLRSTFEANEASDEGGAIFSTANNGDDDAVVLVNSTFVANRAVNGSLLAMEPASGGPKRARLFHVTAVDNVTTSNGGSVVDAGPAMLVIYSALFARNLEGTSNPAQCLSAYSAGVAGAGGGGAFTQGSLSDEESCGTLTEGVAAGLGTFALHEGNTLTKTYSLEATSPAVDSSECDFDPYTEPSDDQNGTSRPQGTACDAGAYETKVPARLYVHQTNAVNSTTDPSSCAAPDHNTIASAIAAAVSGDIIVVCTGTYFEGGLTVPPSITAITIRGEVYPALADPTVFPAVGPQEGAPVLDGRDLNNLGDDESRTRIISAGNSALTAENITFRHGRAENNGGAIIARTLVVEHAAFFRNNAVGGATGGAIEVTGALGTPSEPSATITSSRFEQNTAVGGGGAVKLASYGEVEQSTFDANRTGSFVATDTNGGAVWSLGDLSVDSSSFTNNRLQPDVGASASYGSAIAANGTLTLLNSTVTGNQNDMPGANGAVAGLQLEVRFSTITGNTAVQSDVAGLATSGNLTLGGSIVAGNTNDDCARASLVDLGSNVTDTAACKGSGTSTQLVADLAALRLGVAGMHPGTSGTVTVPLLDGSPAVNAASCTLDGDLATALAVDQRGGLRPRDTSCDAGAFEGAFPARKTFECVVTANESADSISMIDVSNGEETQISAGDGARSVDLTADGRYAWVANSAGESVSVIDLAQGSTVATVALPGLPNAIALTPDESRAYVAIAVNQSDATKDVVVAIDTASRTVVSSIDVGDPNFWDLVVDVAVSPDGTRAYAALSRSSGVVAVDIDPSSPTYHQVIGSTVPFGFNSYTFDLDISPLGTRLFAAQWWGLNKDLAIVDLSDRTVTGVPEPVSNFEFSGVAVTPDGKRAYVTESSNSGSNSVFVIGLSSDEIIGSPIPLGPGTMPAAIAINASGTRAYVANVNGWFSGEAVSVIDIDSTSATFNTKIGVYDLGRQVSGLVTGQCAKPGVAWIERAGSPQNVGDSCLQAPYVSIADAVSSAVAGDVIHVCAGTYREPEIEVTVDGLTIVGDGDDRTEVVIDGELVPEDASSRHRLFDARGLSITFENLTLRNGEATSTSDHGSYGGAVYAYAVTFVRTLVEENDAQGGGAVFVSSDGYNPPCSPIGNVSGDVVAGDCAPVFAAGALTGPSVTVGNSDFYNNGVGSAIVGGAVYAMGGVVSVAGAEFEGNEAMLRSSSPLPSDGAGGAIQAETVAVAESYFGTNKALLHGGAISARSVVITGSDDGNGSLFAGNEAAGDGDLDGIDDGYGGAVWADGVDVMDATFRSNTADFGGGIASAAPPSAGSPLPSTLPVAGSVVVARSLFEANEASRRGGGILNDAEPGVTSISNSTFTQNKAYSIDANTSATYGAGGAVYAQSALTLHFNTFTDNEAVEGGGTFFSVPSPEVVSNIFVFPTDVEGTYDESEAAANGCGNWNTWAGGAPATDTTNLTNNNWCPGTVATTAEIALLPLDSQGGPTGYFALDSTSVAIDAADAAACPSLVTSDQRGIERAVGSSCDIGSIEYFATVPFNTIQGQEITFEVPAGVTELYFLLAGGGGAGGDSDVDGAGGGGGGGEVVACTISNLTDASVVTYYIGWGGGQPNNPIPSDNGESSWVKVDGIEVCVAAGGKAGAKGEYAPGAGFGGSSGATPPATPSSGGTAGLCPIAGAGPRPECAGIAGFPLAGGGGGGAGGPGGHGTIDGTLPVGGDGGPGLTPSGTGYGDSAVYNLGGGGGGAALCFDAETTPGQGSNGGGAGGGDSNCENLSPLEAVNGNDGGESTGGGGGGGAGGGDGGAGGSGTGYVRMPRIPEPEGEPIYVCLSKTYVVYGARYFEPKVYYCVEEEGATPPGLPEPGDDSAEVPTDGFSTVLGDRVVDVGVVSELVESAEDEGIWVDGPSPLHFDHIPDGWRKVNPEDYPDTTPPTCTTEYEQGDEVSESGMPITCTGGDPGEGYVFDYSLLEGGLQIYPARLTVKPKHLRVPYGSPEPDPYEYTVRGFKLGETVEVLDDLPVCNSEYTDTAPAGSRFDITCRDASAANYSFRYKSSHIHVDKQRVDLRPSDRTITYGDPVPSVAWSLSGIRGPESALAPDRLAGFVAPVCATSYVAGSSAGAYAIDCSGASSTNYEFVAEPATLTVNKATLAVVPSSASVTYGSGPAQVGFALSGFVNGETVPGSGYQAPRCLAPSYTSATPAGSLLTVECTGGSSRNYVFDVSSKAVLAVTKAPIMVLPDSRSVAYGSSVPVYTFRTTGWRNGESPLTNPAGLVMPVCGSSHAPSNGAGSVSSIVCTGGSADNYSFDTSATASVTVTKAALSVTADAKSTVYGQAAPVLTGSVSGFVNGESSATASGFAAPTCTTSYTVGANAGSYPITCVGGSAANYTFTYTSGMLSVGKVVLRAVPGNASVVYGTSSHPSVPVTVTGFVGGQTVSTASGYRAPSCALAGYSSATDAGTYTITCAGGSAANYTFDTSATSVLTVTKAPATITASSPSVTYGSATPAWAFTVSGLRNGQTATTVAGMVAPVCSSGYSALSNAGTIAPVSCSGASSANYNFTYVTGKATVVKAPLIVTPNSLTITKGSAIPAYTTVITGWQNGQGPTTAAGYVRPVCKSSYTTRSAAGTYTITCTGGSATNYTFTYRTGTLTVR